MWQDSELVRVCQRVHDRTWNQGLSGCATRLGTGQSLSSGLEFESQRSEFECRRLDLLSIGSEFVSVVHKGVIGRNTGVIVEHCGVWGCKGNKSRVRTRITDSGSGREQQCGAITIWRTESGLQWGPRLGFDPRCRYGDGCPGHQAGIVSPKCLNSDYAQAGNQCSVWGLSGRSGCLKDRQDDFEVLEGSLMCVWCLLGLGVMRSGSHSI